MEASPSDDERSDRSTWVVSPSVRPAEGQLGALRRRVYVENAVRKGLDEFRRDEDAEVRHLDGLVRWFRISLEADLDLLQVCRTPPRVKAQPGFG